MDIEKVNAALKLLEKTELDPDRADDLMDPLEEYILGARIAVATSVRELRGHARDPEMSDNVVVDLMNSVQGAEREIEKLGRQLERVRTELRNLKRKPEVVRSQIERGVRAKKSRSP